jgi:hypothetical protein
MAESQHEDGTTSIDPAWLQEQAREWAETLAASTKPFVSIEGICAWGGGVGDCRDAWESEPLDIPRELAVEMMRWLEQRAGEQAQTGGAL